MPVHEMQSSSKDGPGQVWAVGLMTGTALDGNIDVALLRTDGDTISAFGHYALSPYKSDTVELLHQCQKLALDWQFDGPEPALFAHVEQLITTEQALAVKQLLHKAKLTPEDISVVGFHGQSVLHRAPTEHRTGMTRQLGDGSLMARNLGIDTVNDFRSADIRAGGHGAPLSAIFHQALLKRLGTDGDTAVVNLGGVANLSWWDGAERLVAFDTGPANAPINDFIRYSGNGEFDRDGAYALQGKVDESRLLELLDHQYLVMPYPKSLDRFDFSWRMADGLDLFDGAALLSAFAGASVGRGLDLLPRRPERIIVCGGGRHNPSLLQSLRCRASVHVDLAEAVGWDGDAIEAQCFAYLAVRSVKSMPLSFPETTGVAMPTSGGVLHCP